MLNPGLVFAVAVVAFVVITWRLRWPLPLGLIATSMLAAALAGYTTPFRHLVEGGFGYINLTLGLFAGAFFGQTMRLSGAADAVAVKMDQVLRGNDWLILGFSGAILFLVGMFVGIAGIAVLDRKSVVKGKSVSVRVGLGGVSIINKNNVFNIIVIFTQEKQK